MGAEPQPHLTEAEYLAFERDSECRHEYLGGEIFAMSGASREHNLINTNLVVALHPQCRKRGCEVYANDMRVRIPETGLYTYPDIVVTCGDPHFEDDQHDTLVNPSLIIEVLSPSTEDYDRGRKFAHYRSLASLQAYGLIAQSRAHVEIFTRQPLNRWLLWETNDLDAVVEIPAVHASLTFAEIYDRVPGISVLVE